MDEHSLGPVSCVSIWIPPCAGFGGYHHPRAPSNNRAQLLKEMAKDAEREGWISREQHRHGGIYKYALTDCGQMCIGK